MNDNVPPVSVLDLMPVEQGGIAEGSVADVAGQILVVYTPGTDCLHVNCLGMRHYDWTVIGY